MIEMDALKAVICSATGMDSKTFDLSAPHWQLKNYKKW